MKKKEPKFYAIKLNNNLGVVIFYIFILFNVSYAATRSVNLKFLLFFNRQTETKTILLSKNPKPNYDFLIRRKVKFQKI